MQTLYELDPREVREWTSRGFRNPEFDWRITSSALGTVMVCQLIEMMIRGASEGGVMGGVVVPAEVESPHLLFSPPDVLPSSTTPEPSEVLVRSQQFRVLAV